MIKKMPPKPHVTTMLTGEYQVHFHSQGKSTYQAMAYTTLSQAEAGTICLQKTALWMLQPLASWLRGQEHVGAVLELSNPYRKRYIGQMHSTVIKMMAHPAIMPEQVANWLLTEGLTLMQGAMPGRSSRYYQGATELAAELRTYALQYGTRQAPKAEGNTVSPAKMPYL